MRDFSQRIAKGIEERHDTTPSANFYLICGYQNFV